MSTSFIAVLDHEHLENSLFLTSFARSLAKLGNRKGIIIHGDSPYTDRLIQTGMMREDARIRAIKDLNKRLIGLFADQGVPTIGIHGFQKGLVKKEGEMVRLDKDSFERLHNTPNVLLSSLILKNEETVFLSLPDFAYLLSGEFKKAEILLFSRNEKDELMVSDSEKDLKWNDLPDEFIEESLPLEFRDFGHPVKMTTATDLENWPNLKKATKII